jgi:predicted DNA-binding protein
MDNKITPHKGGRTADLHIRIKPELLEKLRRIAKEQGKSQADIIEKFIEAIVEV